MSRDINDIIKEVAKHNKDLHKVDDRISKEIDSVNKELQLVKKDIKIVSSKIDQILDLLTTLSIFIEDAENIIDEDIEDYESNEGWLPEVSEWESHYDEEDDNEENDG